MSQPSNDRELKRQPSVLADVIAAFADGATTGTIFLIVLTAFVCCAATEPSWQLVVPLAALAVFHFVSAVCRRRSLRRRREPDASQRPPSSEG